MQPDIKAGNLAVQAIQTVVPQEGQGLLSDLNSARQALLDRGISPGSIAAQCGVVAVTLAFLFQITHNVGYLPVGTVSHCVATIESIVYGVVAVALDLLLQVMQCSAAG